MSDPAPGSVTDRAERAGETGATAGAPPAPADFGAVFAALPGPTAVFAADPPHFTLLAASDALVAASGRPRDALIGRPLAEAFPDPGPPQDGAGVAALRASLAAAVRTGRPQRMARHRYDLQRPDGAWEVRYWDALNTPVRGEGGAAGGAPVRAVLHQTEDVTARVRAEHAAAQAEVRAARVLERIGDAHVALDPEFRLTAVNAAAERLLGRPRHELLGCTHWDVFPASVGSESERAYRRVAAEGVEQHFTQHYVGEGYDRHLEIDAYPTEEGGGPGHGVAIFWRDVTERVRDGATLAAFRTLVEHASDAHAIFDAAGRVLWANQLMADRLGYTPEALVGRHVSDLDAHYDAARYAELFARARAGHVAPFESEHRRRDGSTFPVEVTATVVALPEGERLFSAVRDITARKAAQAELEAAYQQLQDQATELEAQAEALQATTIRLEEQIANAERARAELAASEAKYRELFTAIDEGFCVIDLLFDGAGRPIDYRFVETNPAFVQQTGLVDAVGRTVRELVPHIEAHWIETYGHVAATGEPTRFQMGSEAMGRWFDVFAFRIGAPDARQVAVLFTDRTAARAAEAERARLAAALEVERARLAYVFQQAPSFLAVLRGPDHVIALANAAYEQLVGRRGMVGKPVAEALPEVVGQGFVGLLDRVLATGEPFVGRELPVTLARTPGAPPEERFVDFVYLPLVEAGGARAGVIAHGTDVTEQVRARREAERLLAESERERAEAERARRETAGILRAASDGILGVDRAGRTTFVNPAAERLLGWTADELVGRPQHALIHHTRADGSPYPAAECALYRAVRDGTAGHVEGEVFWRKDGTSVPVEYAMMPLREEGEVVGAVVTFRDVTARRAAEAERLRLLAAERAARAAAEAEQARAEAASREADEANQAKSGFLATMSHELRTPINAMLGYTQLLELGLAGPLTEQQRSYLARLAASSQHLLGLVNDVLDLSKIEAGEARVAHEDATTGPAVRAALDLVRPQAAAKGVRLVDGRPDEGGVAFVGDEDRVRQVALNLLGNAVKFTPPGGTVAVTCGTEPATPAAAGHLQGAGPWAYVRVADTGVGIPPDEQERIFDPFHQVDSRHTRKAGGTGLGLAISRRLARLMGGDLTVESVPGAGSTFTVWLPAARPAAGGRVETAAERSARAERDVAALAAPGLGDVGHALRASVDDVLAAYADQLRTDPAVPRAREMRRVELEDHVGSLCADLAQSLAIVEAAGPEAADLLRDGTAIQRAIAEAHGARRHAQGFDEAAVRRDHQLFRQEVERAVRGRLQAAAGGPREGAPEGPPGDVGGGDGADGGADAAVRVLLGLIDRAEAVSVRAWRQAAGRAADAPRGGPGVARTDAPDAAR